MKKNYILFIAAGILAVIALFLYGFNGRTGSTTSLKNENTNSYQNEEMDEDSDKGVEIARISEDITPIPTATPKPLPTATPTPIPTVIPDPTEAPNNIGDNWNDASDDFSEEDSMNRLNDITTPCRIFVGDDRLQTLSAYSYDDTDQWLCYSSADATWFLDTACPSITGHLTNGSTIIISLGLYDLANAQDYATIINTYAQAWKDKGCKVYFVSLGPVESTSYISNEDIMSFNTVIYNSTNCGFIDIYNYLASDGFGTTDGINYDGATSQSVYDYIVGNIQ